MPRLQTTSPATPETFAAGDLAGSRLDLIVAERLKTSRTAAATLIANGSVTVNGARERASHRPASHDTIAISMPAAPPDHSEVLGEDIPLSVVYEDADIMVVDKAAGMVVHPAPGNWTGTLVNALVGRGSHLPGAGDERAGLVHRLDKETSGLLVIARSEIAHRRLSAAIADRRVTRRYAAMAWGHLDADTLSVDQPIARDPRDRKRMAVVSNGKSARTDFRRLARFASVDLLRARLHSGRTHQIRVHLASVGHPVVGDDTYGGGGGRRLAQLPVKRHFLHAAWLQFHHPVTGEQMDFRSPLPDDLHRSIAALGESDDLYADPDPLATFAFFDSVT
ncbi:MAG: RluA family pseudouridine synthase [Gemmatimonadaceae bacterium]